MQTVSILALAVLAVLVILIGLVPKRRSARRITAEAAPGWWSEVLQERLPWFRLRSPDERAEVLKKVQVFLADQRIQGVGCEPEAADLVFISATAVMMAWGFDGFRYPNVRDILIYPEAFDEDFQFRADGDRLGELTDGGPIIFSLPALREAQHFDDAIDVAVHEMAHVLDLMMAPEAERFRSEFDEVIDGFLADALLVGRISQGQSPLDDYALENEQEFFAVASEVFFHDPELLLDYHPTIYDWLARVYSQDPLTGRGARG